MEIYPFLIKGKYLEIYFFKSIYFTWLSQTLKTA